MKIFVNYFGERPYGVSVTFRIDTSKPREDCLNLIAGAK